MPTSISKIEISAPATRVWDALVKPELVKLWQFGSQLETSWEIGTPIRFITPWGDQVFEQWGKVLTFVPTESLKYSLVAPRADLIDSPENYFFMTYLLEEEKGTTTLSIVQDDPRPQSAPIEEQPGEEDTQNPILLGLKSLLENP
jgi:uncharacterized protein YndB with AHSA1/START domain